MYIISSNQLDQLAGGLAENLRVSGIGVFEKEMVLVQSKAMAKWLKLQIASRNGLAAQIEFLYLKEFISRVLYQLDIKVDEAFWSNETLVWRIYQHLPGLEGKHPVLSRFIKGDMKRRHQLSVQVAGLYDEYMIYRPEWLNAWENGQVANLPFDSVHQTWQMELWQKLCEEDRKSFHHALRKFNQSKVSKLLPFKLPKLISIFGITNMPAIFIQFFDKLSKLFPEHKIHFYYLSPCFEYWADFKPRTNYFNRSSQDDLPEFLESKRQIKPYVLLKSWGVLGRDFLSLLVQHTDFNTAEFAIENTRETQLAMIQNGILKLEDQDSHNFIEDGSIAIHACHTPMRELEILLDYIKKLFRSNPDLKPHDVMVLCPDISRYSPYIKTVFESVEGDWKSFQKQIPFSISDQSLKSSSVLVSGFLKLLKLPRTRLVNQEVMDLLQIKAIRQSFEIEEDDLNVIKDWIKKSEIRWGKDAATRELELGVRAFHQNSWEFGFERLLSGYAFDDEILYEDSLSLPIGNDGLVLGRFKNFINHLYQLFDDFSSLQTPLRWSEILFDLMDKFIYQHESEALERSLLINAIQKLSQSWERSQLEKELSSDMVVHALQGLLEEINSSQGFLDRGVTFCTMLPMRSIPSKVVCLLGMNDGEFPRIDTRSGFDLMEKNWRQGDRSVRLNDRYIFLESLLSAQEHLYISYCGFDPKDNTKREPSILVSELIEILSEGRRPFNVVYHPMHAHSPRYFNGELSSFSHRHFEMAIALQKPKVSKKLVCTNEITTENHESVEKIVEIQDLISFFKHPARAFLKRHFGTSFQQDEIESLQECEDFEKQQGLKAYLLKRDVHEKIRQSDATPQTLMRHFLATGKFPFGLQGELAAEEMMDKMFDFQKQLSLDEAGICEEKMDVLLDVGIDDLKVEGKLGRLFGEHYIPYSYSKDDAMKRLAELIPFLVLSLNTNVQSMKIHFDDVILLVTAKSPETIKGDLSLLMDLYTKGLAKPLPFLPKCFVEFHKGRKGVESEEKLLKAREKARKIWLEGNGASGSKPESEDEAIGLCFGSTFPGDHPEFGEPLWAIMQTLSDLLNRYTWKKYR